MQQHRQFADTARRFDPGDALHQSRTVLRLDAAPCGGDAIERLATGMIVASDGEGNDVVARGAKAGQTMQIVADIRRQRPDIVPDQGRLDQFIARPTLWPAAATIFCGGPVTFLPRGGA